MRFFTCTQISVEVKFDPFIKAYLFCGFECAITVIHTLLFHSAEKIANVHELTNFLALPWQR